MQTINMTNKQAFDMLTLIERTILKIKAENKTDTYYYDEIKSIENAIHESCPELVLKWHSLQDLIKTLTGDEAHRTVQQACDEFDKWITTNQ